MKNPKHVLKRINLKFSVCPLSDKNNKNEKINVCLFKHNNNFFYEFGALTKVFNTKLNN